MPTYTTRLNLPKPLGTESVNREKHNELVEAIDAAAAKKTDVDSHVTDDSAHGATSAATPNRIVRRDANGRLKAANPSASDDVATKGTVDAAIATLLNGAPGALDTLLKLAAAIGNDPTFATTVTNALALKLNTSSYTAADILTKLKTVDGSGSGVDADLLDGVEGANYVRKDSAATMTSVLTAQNNTSYTTKQVRNITLSTADPSGGSNGDVWIKYTP